MFVQNYARRPGLGNVDPNNTDQAVWNQIQTAIAAGFDLNNVQKQWEQTRGMPASEFWRIFNLFTNPPPPEYVPPPASPAPPPPMTPREYYDSLIVAPEISREKLAQLVQRANDLVRQRSTYDQILSILGSQEYVMNGVIDQWLKQGGFNFAAAAAAVPAPTPNVYELQPPLNSDQAARLLQQANDLIRNGTGFAEVVNILAGRWGVNWGAMRAWLQQVGIDQNSALFNAAPAAPQMTRPVAAPPPPTVTVQTPIQSIETGGGARPGAGGGWVPAPRPMAPPPPGAGVIPGTISADGTIPSEGTPHNLPDVMQGGTGGTPAPKASGLLILAALALLAGQ